jgi:hypothetical protein
MSSSPFASLNAGMLVRKGAASPSLEASYRPASAIQAFAPPTAAPPKPPEPPQPAAPAAPPPSRPRLVQPAPAACAAPAADTDAARISDPGFSARAGVRLTREQARALKLAALLLDRPQQELLADGLDLRLEAVACGPLSHCACFQAAVDKIARS